MKPVLVWGASGFIGQHLVNTLVARQIPVLALTRRAVAPGTTSNNSRVQWITVPEGDAAIGTFTEAVRQVDVVFNLAGSSGAVASNLNPIASLEGNCYVQARFLQACELSGAKPHVVFASSRLVYGTPDVLPVTENSLLKPSSHYATHKVAIEHYHQIAALRSVITYTVCRISNPYGAEGEPEAGHWFGFIDSMIEKACRGARLEIFGDGKQLRDYIYIDDLSDVLCRCAFDPQAQNETFNIGYGESISIRDAAQIISEETGAPIVHLPWQHEAALVESGDYIADVSKAKSRLGFQPKYQFAGTVQQLIRNRRSSAAERMSTTA